MVRVEITDRILVISLLRWTKLWTLRKWIEIPLEHVVSARVDPDVASEIRDRKWLNKIIGTNVPHCYAAGTFQVRGRIFCDIRHPERTVVIELRDEKLARLIVEVADPQAVAGELGAHTENRAA